MQKYEYNIFSKFRGELMGIAILGVCLLHGFHWAGIDNSMIAKAIEPLAKIAFTEGFLFLSGFGLYYSFSKNNDKKVFYIKRLNRVLLPYMMMGLPFFLYGLVMGGNTFPAFLLKLSTLYFWFFGNDGMWYISMSIAMYLLFPFIYHFIFSTKKENIMVLRTLLLVVLSVVICSVLYLLNPDYYKTIEIGISKTPMFIIGMLVGHLACKGKRISLFHIFGGGSLLCITFFLKHHSDFFIPIYEMAYRLLMMSLVCIVFVKFDMKGLKRVLSWFGKYSLEIYVLQMLVLGIIGNILKSIGCSSSYLPMVQTILTFGIVIGVCAPVHKWVALRD